MCGDIWQFVPHSTEFIRSFLAATRLISRALSHSGPHESTERHRGYFTHLRPPDSRGSEKRRSARAEVRGVPPRFARAIDSSDNDWFGQFEHGYKLSFVPGYCFMRRCGFAVPTTVQDQRAPGSIPEKALIFTFQLPSSFLPTFSIMTQQTQITNYHFICAQLVVALSRRRQASRITNKK